jgi:shikimate dehydrogenase
VNELTEIYGVIGNPVKHSLSPKIYNETFKYLNLNATYLKFELSEESLSDALRGAAALGFKGLSVTMPFKEAAAKLVEPVGDAVILESVNCIEFFKSSVKGYSTDGEGFRDFITCDLQLNPKELAFLIYGSGAVSKALSLCLVNSQVKDVFICGRNLKNVQLAASKISKEVKAGKLEEFIDEANVIINATPVGMKNTVLESQLPFDINLIKKNHIVIDLIYHPDETPLLQAAKGRCQLTANGLGMLVHQAAHQFQIWTGIAPPIEIMHKAVAAL